MRDRLDHLPALVNVKLRDEFRLSFFLYTLPRVELPVALLTKSQSYWRKPTRAETLIECIYREVRGRRMPQAIRRILLRKPTAKRKPR